MDQHATTARQCDRDSPVGRRPAERGGAGTVPGQGTVDAGTAFATSVAAPDETLAGTAAEAMG